MCFRGGEYKLSDGSCEASKRATPASKAQRSAAFRGHHDGAEVYSTQIGGLKDNEVQARDMNEARTIIDARWPKKSA